MSQAYATVEDVQDTAPELASSDEGLLQTWLDVAATMIGLSAWGDRASVGHTMLTAHLVLTVPGADGTGAGTTRVVTSESDGRSSVSYAAPTLSDAELSTTAYGQAYLLLRRIVRGKGTGIVLGRRTC